VVGPDPRAALAVAVIPTLGDTGWAGRLRWTRLRRACTGASERTGQGAAVGATRSGGHPVAAERPDRRARRPRGALGARRGRTRCRSGAGRGRSPLRGAGHRRFVARVALPRGATCSEFRDRDTHRRDPPGGLQGRPRRAALAAAPRPDGRRAGAGTSSGSGATRRRSKEEGAGSRARAAPSNGSPTRTGHRPIE
jgi:hypothetical protein